MANKKPYKQFSDEQLLQHIADGWSARQIKEEYGYTDISSVRRRIANTAKKTSKELIAKADIAHEIVGGSIAQKLARIETVINDTLDDVLEKENKSNDDFKLIFTGVKSSLDHLSAAMAIYDRYYTIEQQRDFNRAIFDIINNILLPEQKQAVILRLKDVKLAFDFKVKQ